MVNQLFYEVPLVKSQSEVREVARYAKQANAKYYRCFHRDGTIFGWAANKAMNMREAKRLGLKNIETVNGEDWFVNPDYIADNEKEEGEATAEPIKVAPVEDVPLKKEENNPVPTTTTTVTTTTVTTTNNRVGDVYQSGGVNPVHTVSNSNPEPISFNNISTVVLEKGLYDKMSLESANLKELLQSERTQYEEMKKKYDEIKSAYDIAISKLTKIKEAFNTLKENIED